MSALQPLRRLLMSSRSTYRVNADDLTGGLLDLLEAAQEVPVPRLGDNGVRASPLTPNEFSHLGCDKGDFELS